MPPKLGSKLIPSGRLTPKATHIPTLQTSKHKKPRPTRVVTLVFNSKSYMKSKLSIGIKSKCGGVSVAI